MISHFVKGQIVAFTYKPSEGAPSLVELRLRIKSGASFERTASLTGGDIVLEGQSFVYRAAALPAGIYRYRWEAYDSAGVFDSAEGMFIISTIYELP